MLKQLSFERLQDWKSLELFEREAKVLAQLNHPHIPKSWDYFKQESESGTAFFLVQEYIPGNSLQACIEQGRYFSEAEVLDMALELTAILVYLQALHPPIFHRDIKPSNLILSQSGQVYLIDFGAVRDRLENQNGSTVVGTFGYMAPEQFQGRATPATDIYALGATLLSALTHREPQAFQSTGLKLNFRSQLNCSRGLAEVLDKMLEPDQSLRYPNAKTLLNDLQALKAGKLPEVLLQQELQKLQLAESAPPRTKSKLLLLMAGVTLLFAILTLFYVGSFKMGQAAKRESYDAIKQRLEKTYEETYRAEYGPPPQRSPSPNAP